MFGRLTKLSAKCSSSVNKNQMSLFTKLTNWWHPAGPSFILYTYNYKRIQFIRKHLQFSNEKQPLKHMDILDVGCGAGFLSESLARLGGNVIGLDPNQTSYQQAMNHKSTKSDLKHLQYYNISLQQFLETYQCSPKKFDIITSMQVLEHVTNPQQFLNLLSSCTKDTSLVFLSTIRRTMNTWLTHILLAQKILGIVPSGTHHHQQFINPDECKQMMTNCGFDILQILQLGINLNGQLQEKPNGGNYLVAARKSTPKLI